MTAAFPYFDDSPASSQTAYAISDAGSVSAARRAALEVALALGFDAAALARIEAVLHAAAANIRAYATRGEIVLRSAVRHDGAAGLEILALDAGPGLSTAQSASQHNGGLAQMQSLSDAFDIYSAPGHGTALALHFWLAARPTHASGWDLGVVCLPMHGEFQCGDAWAAAVHDGLLTVAMIDGLGHGPLAASAANAAVAAMAPCSAEAPAAMLAAAHADLLSTCGAAVGVARLDSDGARSTFAGIGNIAGFSLDGAARHGYVSHNGVVGGNMRKVQEFGTPWHDGMLLLMHSDGLKSRWDLDLYPGLSARSPAIIAAVLYRDFARSRDDITVLAMRRRQDLS
ncbi:MAG TPA: serine/threonine protein kinase [Burkholderiaceae bacterium]